MKFSTRARPPNSILLITDPPEGDIPKSLGPTNVASTRSSVVVGTLMAADGETSITLSDDEGDSRISNLTLAFDGPIDTPRHIISVCSSSLERLLTLPTQSARSRVRVWTNDDSEPDLIHVTITPA